jgi:hypothetical protein
MKARRRFSGYFLNGSHGSRFGLCRQLRKHHSRSKNLDQIGTLEFVGRYPTEAWYDKTWRPGEIKLAK